jgi:hypothetical protein
VCGALVQGEAQRVCAEAAHEKRTKDTDNFLVTAMNYKQN